MRAVCSVDGVMFRMFKTSKGNIEKNVILDVGGERFVARKRNLERFPSTR